MARIKRRGRVWYAWLPALGGGTRLVSTRCTDRRAAESEAARLERSAVNPDGEAEAAATIRGALELLIRDRQSQATAGRRSQETVSFYTKKSGVVLDTLADVLKRPATAPILLREVSPALADDYVLQRRADGVAEATISHELTTWRTAMRLAKRRGWWAGDIEAVFPRGFLGRSKPRERWLTLDEVGALYRAMVRPTAYRGGSTGPERGNELFAVVAFSIATSAEWSAIWRAKREDIAEDASIARVRGAKNDRRDRVVPLQLLPFRLLASYAREHGDGASTLFLDRSSSFRHRLAEACDRAGIPRCSPNDLRRTHAKWLRLAGVAPSNIAPSMGHADSRMVERVYGKVSAVELAGVQAAEIARGEGSETVRYVSGSSGTKGPFGATAEKGETDETPIFLVPRDGIEPPTRGFSIPNEPAASLAKVKDSEGDCTVYVRSPAVEAEVVEAPTTTVHALAMAIEHASKAGEWAVVALLAKELEARRLEASGNVPPVACPPKAPNAPTPNRGPRIPEGYAPPEATFRAPDVELPPKRR